MNAKSWAWEIGALNQSIIRRFIVFPSLSRSQIERTRAHHELTYGPVKLRRIARVQILK